MSVKRTTACAALVAGTALLVGCAAMERDEWHGERHDLSAAAEQAIKAEFPDAKIEKVRCEREKGAGALNVELEQGKQESEVKVSQDGIIIAVETDLAVSELPQAVTDALAKEIPGAIKEAAKKEVRAEPKLVKLPTSRMAYTVEVVNHHKRGEIEIAPDGSIVSPLSWECRREGEREHAENKEGEHEERRGREHGEESRQHAMNLADLQKVAEALQKQMPQATLGAVKMENEAGMALYEVKLTVGDARMEAKVGGDGMIAEMETEIAAKELPAAVAATVASAAPDAQIVRAKKQETMAEVKMTPLTTPKVCYEVELSGERKVKVTPDGVILERFKGD